MAANRRIALLIATDTYADDEFTNLRTPCTDAGALAELLADPGIGAFEVTTLLNRPAQEIRQVLDETFTDAHRDDLVLLHVSGHGIRDEAGKLHLVMPDTRRRHLRATAIAATWVRELIDHCAARRVVVWLDCCFSGAFPPGFTPKGVETVAAIDQLTSDSGRGCAVMTASTKIQYAFEQDQASVFTAAITAGLRTGAADLDGDGFVDVGELYDYVFDWVRARTPDQTPTRNDVLTGDIYIAYSPNGTGLPLDLAPEIRQLLRSPDPRYRSMGITALTTSADAGDESARAALAVLGVEPPLPPRPIPVAEVPRTASRFELIRSAKAFPTFWRLVKLRYVTGMAFDPAKPHRVCVSGNNIINYLDVETGTRVDGPLCRTSGRLVRAIAFSPDGRLLATASDTTTAVWVTDSMSLAIGSVTGARAMAFSPDGALFATVDLDIHLWEVESRSEIGKIQTGNLSSIQAIDFSPDGRLLATGGDAPDRAVQLWDPRKRELIRELRGHGTRVRTVKFSPDGRLLAAAGDDGAAVHLWDVQSGRLIRKLVGHRSSVLSIAFSPDGEVLVSGSMDGTVRAWDPDGREPHTVLRGPRARVVAVGFSPAGDRLAVACTDGQVLVWRRG